MENKVFGLHHITAIADQAKTNLEFYTGVLGQRLVKKTVNFDDPHTYHFYFGDEVGTPGTLLTFFPWEGVGQGRNGRGMPTEIAYSVPKDSLEFWKERFGRFNVKQHPIDERFGERFLSFEDPDGLHLELVVSEKADERNPWETKEIKADCATKGFHHTTLCLTNIKATADILTEVLDYKFLKQDGDRFRFQTDSVENAAIIDLQEIPDASEGSQSAGTIHHIAFRVKDDNILMNYREKILSRNIHITPKVDRDYFFSLYFREPGGVLFELATENPGFTKDEPVSELGSHLKLPTQYEPDREEIEMALPVLS